MVKVSLFASAVRPKLWSALFKSLEGTSVEWEVIFAGNTSYTDIPLDVIPHLTKGRFRYIQTSNIKPSQCYEIARRACLGEVTIWIADDCLFPNDSIGKAYRYWKNQNNTKLIISMLTHERYQESFFITNLDDHRLKGIGTPLMAPIGMMSREYLDKLGGYDRRYICGQTENDVVMRILADGGEIKKFEEEAVIIDHFVGHGGVTTTEGYNRPFAKGYEHDRRILEGSWFINGRLSTEMITPGNKKFKQVDKHEPFEDKDILTKSQSFNIPEMWE